MRVKEIVTEEQFTATWTQEQREKLSPEERKRAFNLYNNKILCMNRDNYLCKNEYCDGIGYKQKRDSKGKIISSTPFKFIEVSIEERWPFMTVHHVIPRRDFKENSTLQKYLGYDVHDLINLVTLCKICHQGYEKAKIAILLDGKIHKREKPISVNMKAALKDARKFRKNLKRLMKWGWSGIDEDKRLDMWLAMWKWLSTPYFDWEEYEEDED